MKLLERIQKVDEEISARLVLRDEKSVAHKIIALIGHSCDSWYWLITRPHLILDIWSDWLGCVRAGNEVYCSPAPPGRGMGTNLPSQRSAFVSIRSCRAGGRNCCDGFRDSNTPRSSGNVRLGFGGGDFPRGSQIALSFRCVGGLVDWGLLWSSGCIYLSSA